MHANLSGTNYFRCYLPLTRSLAFSISYLIVRLIKAECKMFKFVKVLNGKNCIEILWHTHLQKLMLEICIEQRIFCKNLNYYSSYIFSELETKENKCLVSIKLTILMNITYNFKLDWKQRNSYWKTENFTIYILQLINKIFVVLNMSQLFNGYEEI